MSLSTWWLFFTAVFLLSGTPGPNMLHVLSRSVQFGLRGALVAASGCFSAFVLVLVASAAGLGAVLGASPLLFETIRYAGVAYLVWLGVRTWRGSGTHAPGAAPVRPGTALFRDAFAIGISNPKLLLFATAFLPQFVEPGAARLPQFAILIATFSGVELFWYAVYGIGGRQLAAHLTRPGLKRAFDRITGGLFLGFGAALLGMRS